MIKDDIRKYIKSKKIKDVSIKNAVFEIALFISKRIKKGDKGDKGERGESIVGPMGPYGLKGDTGEKGKDGVNGKDGKDGKDGKTPEIDYNKIEKGMFGKIIEESQKLRKALTKKEKEFEKELLNKVAIMIHNADRIGGGMGRQTVLDLILENSAGSLIRDDLSSQCNGSDKTFTLTEPYKSGTIQLFYTSFPFFYRPVIDFTEDDNRHITLTSEVGSPQTGQTLIAIYEKQR
jgi:hypothetical protein